MGDVGIMDKQLIYMWKYPGIGTNGRIVAPAVVMAYVKEIGHVLIQFRLMVDSTAMDCIQRTLNVGAILVNCAWHNDMGGSVNIGVSYRTQKLSV
ncbi:hypothetical protein CHS0354_003795 [Potamilus streckersoni]|uniref:Uncharacterized protein n=1 Tax=Potamilus streckersoni TaxID=2493646 RepID=A0AAE0T3G9_9BIVA|nr:hypothetical protein CHS0354_003795 [Potamilus streckersoni]